MIQPNLSLSQPVDRIQIVRYETCEWCGFRLMRVEYTSKGAPPSSMNCPICGAMQDESGQLNGHGLTQSECESAFDSWLETHGLDRHKLEKIYYLQFEDFFSKEDG